MQHQKQLQDCMLVTCCRASSPVCSSSLGSRSCSKLWGCAGTAASAAAQAVDLWDGLLLASGASHCCRHVVCSNCKCLDVGEPVIAELTR
jgi:hypothetical protein